MASDKTQTQAAQERAQAQVERAEIRAQEQLARAKGNAQKDLIGAKADATKAGIQAGTAERIAGIEARELSGFRGRANYLKGYHGGGVKGSVIANTQAAFESVKGSKVGGAVKGGGKLAKYGAIAAVGAAGLAYLAGAFRKPLSQSDDISPDMAGDVTPMVNPEEFALPPINTMTGATPPVEGEWVGRTRGEGPEQFASTAVPGVASDTGFDDVGVPARG